MAEKITQEQKTNNKVNKANSNLKRAKNLIFQVKIRTHSIRALFVSLSLITFFLVFFSSLLNIFYLAGTKEEYRQVIPSFLGSSFRGIYVLITTWISAMVSLVSSLIAFFSMKEKYSKNRKYLTTLTLEKELYIAKIGIYKNAKDREYKFLERVMTIMHFNKRFIENEGL